MADNYPSVGLRIDLNEIVDGQALLMGLKRTYIDLRGEAAQTERALAGQGKSYKETGRSAQNAGLTAVQAARQRTKAEQDAFNRSLAQTKAAFQTHIALEAHKSRETRASAQQALDFEIRMRRMALAETQATSRAEIQAAKEKGREQERVARQVYQFHQRMTQQRLAEEKAAAAESARVQSQFNARNTAYGSLSRPELAGYTPARGVSGRRPAAFGGGGGGGGGAGVSGMAGVFDAASAAGARFLNVLSGIRGGIGSLSSAFLDVRVAIGAFLSAMIVKPIFDMMDAMTGLEARTNLYVDSAQEVPYMMAAIYRAAQDSRAPLEAVSKLYTRLAPLGTQLGKGQLELLDIVTTVNKAFAIGGASAAEATSSAQQLAQALSSNRFGGDELRSVAENAPVLLKALADGVNQLSKEGFAGLDKGLNLNAGSFIKWAQSGKANTEVMIAALEKAKPAIDAAFKTMPVTIGQGITVVGNAIKNLVGQVDKMTGTSKKIASSLLNLTAFLESEQTINAVAAAIDGLNTTLKVLGDVMGTLIAYAPTIGALLLGLLGARLLPPIFAAVARTIGMAALSMAVAGRASFALNIGFMALGSGAAAVMSGLSRMMALVGGPWGAAIIAATFAINALANAHKDAAAAADNAKRAEEGIASAMDSSVAYAEKYGASTKDLLVSLVELGRTEGEAAGAAQNGADKNDIAAEAARQRAERERELAASIWDRVAADAEGDTKKAAKSVNGIFGLRNQRRVVGAAAWLSDPFLTDAERGMVGNLKGNLDERIGDASWDTLRTGGAAAYARQQAAMIRNSKPEGLAPAGGSGVSQVSAANDNEAKAIQRKIDKLLEDTRTSEAATEQIKTEMAARRQASTAMTAFYASGVGGAEAYAAILQAQTKAETDAKVAFETKKILADAGVKTQEALTGKTASYVLALIAAKKAEIEAASSQEVLNASIESGDAMRAATAQMEKYTAAVKGGRAAVIDYEREQRVLDELTRRKGVDRVEVEKDVDKQIAAEVGQELALQTESRRESLRLAGMSTREAEKELKILEDCALIYKGNREAGWDFAMSQARARAEIEASAEAAAKLARTLKDQVEQAFVETGRLDFKGLKDAVSRAIRQAIYDQFIAKPISIVIDAAVKVATGKMGNNQLGNGNFLSQLANMFGMGGYNEQTGGYSENSRDAMDAQVDAATGMADSASKMSKVMQGMQQGLQFAGGVMQGYQMGTTAADMLGMKGSQKDPQGQMLMDAAFSAIGTAIGGPIGGAIGSFISRAIGPAIFGKESNHAAGGRFDSQGNFTYESTNKTNAETGRAAQDVGTAIAGFISPLRQLGIDARGVVTGFQLGQRDASYLNVKGEGSARRTAVGDTKALMEEAGKAMLQKAQYESTAMKAYADTLLRANKSFEEIVNQLEKWSAAQKVVTNLQTANLQFSNPRAYQLAQLKQAQLDRRREIKNLGAEGLLTPAQMAAAEAELTKLEMNEIQDTVNRFATTLDGAVVSLQDYVDAQKRLKDYTAGLLTSDASPLSPEAQLAQNRREFEAMLVRAQANDIDALRDISDEADEYLDDARNFYGGTEAYADIFDAVFDALEALSTQAVTDPTTAAVNQAALDLKAAIESQSLELVEAIQAVSTGLQQLAQAQLLAAQQGAQNDQARRAIQAALQALMGGGVRFAA